MLVSTQAPIVWTVLYAKGRPLETLYFPQKEKKIQQKGKQAQNALEMELPWAVFSGFPLLVIYIHTSSLHYISW